MVRILIVGAGATSSLCAYMIRQKFPSKLQCQIIVWEKSRGYGGRMSASRHPEDPHSMAELGAQYITPQVKYKESHKDIFDEVSNQLSPIQSKIEGQFVDQANITNLVGKNGLGSIVKQLFRKSSAEIMFLQKLNQLNLNKQSENSSWLTWKAETENKDTDIFDAVILTMPTPQVIELHHRNNFLNDEEEISLSNAKYSSRYALGLFYPKSQVNLPEYCARYVTHEYSSAIRFVSFDNVKRGNLDGEYVSVVVHSSRDFGIEHLDNPREKVEEILLQEFNKLYPSFPQPNYVKFQKWRYSQVTQPVLNYPGCMKVKSDPLLLLAGDAYTHSNFDGCIESALYAVEQFIEWYDFKNK